MFAKISHFFKDLLSRSPLSAGTPHLPHPPEPELGTPLPDATRFYEETSSDLDMIAGTNISFGTAETTIVDQNGNATHHRRRVSHILGDGRLVTSIEPRIEDGQARPGVDGKCSLCLQKAIQDYEAGLISPEEVQRRSLFSTGSAAECQGCGRKDVCTTHCRPLKRFDGTQSRLCPDCTKAALREDSDLESSYILFGPFMDRKKLPPSNGQEDRS
jgi:hypothetical protein